MIMHLCFTVSSLWFLSQINPVYTPRLYSLIIKSLSVLRRVGRTKVSVQFPVPCVKFLIFLFRKMNKKGNVRSL